jgi:poly-gamma-glutamate synthesis protein (capsule biosynthesis protein)
MGNLLSSQIDLENRIGMMAGMDLVKKVNEDGSTSVSIENLRADLHYTYLEGEYPALRTNIQVYPFSELDDSILPDHDSIYNEFKSVITSMDQNIQIGGV